MHPPRLLVLPDQLYRANVLPEVANTDPAFSAEMLRYANQVEERADHHTAQNRERAVAIAGLRQVIVRLCRGLQPSLKPGFRPVGETCARSETCPHDHF